MGILQTIAKLLSYPQSVATGITGFAPGMLGEARATTGDTEVLTKALDFNRQLRPSELLALNAPAGSMNNKAGRAVGTTANIVYDPLNVTPAALGKLLSKSSKLAPAVKGATTFGRVTKGVAPEGAKGVAKILAERSPQLGQVARRTYQGTMATGNPITGFAAGQILGRGENLAARIAPRILAKSLQNVNTSGLDAAPEAISKELGEDAFTRAFREAQDLEVIKAAQDAAFRKAAQQALPNLHPAPVGPSVNYIPSRFPQAISSNVPLDPAALASLRGRVPVGSRFPQAISSNAPVDPVALAALRSRVPVAPRSSPIVPPQPFDELAMKNAIRRLLDPSAANIRRSQIGF